MKYRFRYPKVLKSFVLFCILFAIKYAVCKMNSKDSPSEKYAIILMNFSLRISVKNNANGKLLDGYYKPNGSLMQHWKVNGEKIECEDPYQQYDFNPSLEYGDFGECCQEIKHGITKYLFSSRGGRHQNCGQNWQLQI